MHLIDDAYYYNLVGLISKFIIHVINTHPLSLEKYVHQNKS